MPSLGYYLDFFFSGLYCHIPAFNQREQVCSCFLHCFSFSSRNKYLPACTEPPLPWFSRNDRVRFCLLETLLSYGKHLLWAPRLGVISQFVYNLQGVNSVRLFVLLCFNQLSPSLDSFFFSETGLADWIFFVFVVPAAILTTVSSASDS